MNRQRSDWADIAKGIGILLVVYGHVQQGLFLSGMKIPEYFFYTEKIIYSFHMQLFFFISGFFVERSLKKGIGEFFWDKVKVLLYPYFLWSFLHGGIQVLLSPYTNAKLTVIDLMQVIYKPIAHFWFLQALFLSLLIYAILRKYLPLYAVLFISSAMYLGKFFVDPGPINNVLRMFLFFVVGSMFAPNLEKVQKGINVGMLVLITAIFIAFQAAVFNFQIVESPSVKLAAAFIGIAFVISLSIYLQNINNSNILKQLGFLAMPIYLAHALGSAGARIVLSKAFHVQNISMHLLIGCIVAVAFPVLLFILTNRLGFPYLFTFSKKSALSQAFSTRVVRESNA
jgi:fucose 4-O-acetylase-like acetyltransferase